MALLPERHVERLRDWWQTWSIYIMIPLSVAAFVVALYFMLHDVM